MILKIMTNKNTPYQTLIQETFPDCDLNNYKETDNACVQAINNDRESNKNFNDNFCERLNRLKEFYKSDSKTISNIAQVLIEIASKKGSKWAGPYSELIALDYWTQFNYYSNTEFIYKEDVNDAPGSIAKIINQKIIDIDTVITTVSGKKIYNDIKSFTSLHDELINAIIKNLRSKIINNNFLIDVDNIYDIDFFRLKLDLQHEINGNLLDELIKAIGKKDKGLSYMLKSGNTIKFKISYYEKNKNTVLLATRYRDSYRMAKDYSYKILDYNNKLMIDEPNMITLVINTWFNREVFIKNKKVINEHSAICEYAFYRSLARRVFFDLANNNDEMYKYYSAFQQSSLKISDISKLISGITFIIDNSINNLCNVEKHLYDTYIFLNPNATNGKLDEYDLKYVNYNSSLSVTMIDDFKYDNY